MSETIQVAQRAHHRQSQIGLVYGIAAYVCWGLVPIYFKLVKSVPPMTVLAHRMAWSLLFLLMIVAVRARWSEVRACLKNRRTLLLLFLSTIAISINWFIYIWAVAHNQVIGASLGYFINPLVTVTLGLLVLHERLRRGQAIALVIALASIVALIVAEHRVPIVAIALAMSFGSYGLIRKQAVVAPTIGLFVETLILLPFALFVIAQQAVANPASAQTYGLLAMSGVVTAVPLIWFAAAARRLRLATMGFLHYITPTGQFLLGRFVYHEPLNATRLACFAGVWVALVIYSVDSLRSYQRLRDRAVEEPV